MLFRVLGLVAVLLASQIEGKHITHRQGVNGTKLMNYRDDSVLVYLRVKVDPAKKWKLILGDLHREEMRRKGFKAFWKKVFHKGHSGLHKIKVAKIIVHPNYRGKAQLWRNDIALVKIRSTTSANVNKVLLTHNTRLADPAWGKDWPGQDEVCAVARWGCTHKVDKNGKLSGTDVSITPEDICKLYYYHVDNNVNLCARTNNFTQAVCKGDSGGPLVCRIGTDWVQAGITSHGHHSHGATPEMYTRVSAYMNWIIQTLSVN